ncbi:MAG TPA: type II toxin-antitoxin system Phd/YefM family antitoxin [Synergistales bacterium]|nr:type II toxin-antitoxin system Phd/YefM family antitoxin [Synergistales bacterium]HRV97782.1 type II toxin-antitoxin system Phd/YefM family antitoxin [Aminobacteriaceae bacterium]
MPHIRPVSDLRNKFAEISKIVHECQEPIFLTKNGYGDMVVMSIEQFERLQFENEIVFKLREAENQSSADDRRYSHADVFDALRERLADGRKI